MTELRQRFIRELQLLNMSPRTITNYIHAVSKLTRFTKNHPSAWYGKISHRFFTMR